MEVVSGRKAARVLLADASITARTYLRTILSGLAVTVEEATDGGEALCILLDREFDLLITDLNMTPITGVQLIMAVRLLPADRRPKIIVHSADSDPFVRALRHTMAPDDKFLAKPVSADDLIAAVTALFPCAVQLRA